MQLTFLGTSSGAPTRDRNVTAQALRLDDGDVWLLDCGEGTQHQLMRSDVKVARLSRILITHLHGDHCYGLPGLLCSIAMHGRTEPLIIIGPTGVRSLVESVLVVSHAELPFALRFVELVGETDLGMHADIALSAHPIVHRVPCYGFALRQAPRRGRLDVQKAHALGVPSGPLLGQLAAGNDVVLASGTTVHPHEVLDAERPGLHIVLLGDTSDPSGIAAAAQGCDLLVHEATYDRSRNEQALQWGHSTTEMAGRFAARVGAKRLVITHFSARYTSNDARIGVPDLVAETSAVCPGIEVVAAHDFCTVML